MADDLGKLDFKPGDPLRAEDLQALADAIRSPAAKFVGGNNVHASQASDGSLSISVPARAKYNATTTGTITARSGTTYGSGPVTVNVNIDGTETPTALSLTVYSVSSTSGGIPSGTRVQIEEFTDGYYYITAVDCG
jgi:hypothetical protein